MIFSWKDSTIFLLEKAKDYSYHQLDMYKLLIFKGGIDLADSNPALAYMVALNRIFCPKKVSKPWRRAKGMLIMKRRKILGMCGFPESESLVRILGKLKPWQVSARYILFIRKELKRNPGLLRTLSFVDSYDGNVISLTTITGLGGVVTSQFLTAYLLLILKYTLWQAQKCFTNGQLGSITA